MNREDYKIAYENVMLANKMLEQEIERLNNIISELEKFVKNCNEYNSKCNSTIYEARAFEDSVILYKIKELKGSDKE
jgi:hypothetical protein